MNVPPSWGAVEVYESPDTALVRKQMGEARERTISTMNNVTVSFCAIILGKKYK